MSECFTGCLLCGKPLHYLPEECPQECALCHQSFSGDCLCEDGHFVCNDCHAQQGIAVIRAACLDDTGRNPIELALSLFSSSAIHMHGPEHHVLVGAALLTAYHNCGGALHWPEALEEMIRRGQKIPGGVCGAWGSCGAALSTGMFVSIVTGATPLGEENWGLANAMTAKALDRIAAMGGPRCCKRDSFTALLAGVAFAEERLGVSMEAPDSVRCDYFQNNAECLGSRCPYHLSHH